MARRYKKNIILEEVLRDLKKDLELVELDLKRELKIFDLVTENGNVNQHGLRF